jgi:hypothetical protein
MSHRWVKGKQSSREGLSVNELWIATDRRSLNIKPENFFQLCYKEARKGEGRKSEEITQETERQPTQQNRQTQNTAERILFLILKPTEPLTGTVKALYDNSVQSIVSRIASCSFAWIS